MKKVIALALAAVLALALCACGKEAKTVDAVALADALAQGVSFDAPMISSAVEQIGYTLDVPEGTTVAGYEADGMTSEMIVAAQCASPEDAAKLKTAIDAYLADLKVETGKYQPEESARLDGAIVQMSGSAVVLCVTSDTETAKGIIKEYLG